MKNLFITGGLYAQKLPSARRPFARFIGKQTALPKIICKKSLYLRPLSCKTGSNRCTELRPHRAGVRLVSSTPQGGEHSMQKRSNVLIAAALSAGLMSSGLMAADEKWYDKISASGFLAGGYQANIN